MTAITTYTWVKLDTPETEETKLIPTTSVVKYLEELLFSYIHAGHTVSRYEGDDFLYGYRIVDNDTRRMEGKYISVVVRAQ